MKALIISFLFFSFASNGQVIKASENYRPFASVSSAVLADGLIDTFPNPLVAYSLRRLTKNYTGNAIRVQRSTDFSYAFIGFTTAGDLDTVALKTFCSTGDCTVRILYDQSGNTNNDSTNVGTLAGPYVVKAGVVVRDGGKPTMSFDGSATSYLSAARNISTNTISTFIVAKMTTSTGGYQRLLNVSPDLYFFMGTNGSNQITTFYGNGSAWGITATQSTTTWLNTSRLVTSINNGNDNQYINGSLISSRSNPMTGFNGQIWIGGVYGVGVTNQLWKGTMSELVVYGTDKSTNRTGIEGNINRYYLIF